MTEERYNGWQNYATWRVNLECFDGWEGELTPESAEEIVTDIIREQTEEGLARDYALAFVANANWYEIAEAHCPSYSEEWREEFAKAFCELAIPDGFDAQADSECSTPWQCPWTWENYEEWALDEYPNIAAQKFYQSIREELTKEIQNAS